MNKLALNFATLAYFFIEIVSLHVHYHASNFDTLEVVGRGSETQLQVCQHFISIT